MSADSLAGRAQSGEQARSDGPTCSAPSCWSEAKHVRVGASVGVLRGGFMNEPSGVPAVPAVSHPQPGPLFDKESLSTLRLRGVSRLSRLKTDLSHVRAHTRTGTHAHTLDDRRISRDSRDTPARHKRENLYPPNRRPGCPIRQPGHPGHRGWSA